MARLAEKVALVTGGASGIGAAICQRFRDEGASVACLDLSESAPYPCDVANAEHVHRIFQRVSQELGPIDIVVNNAGISHIGTVADTSEEDLERILAVNVKGVFNGCKAAVAHMSPKQRGGVILNMASVASVVGIPERFAYSLSKGAVLSMTQSVAIDFIHANIRCNAIGPGRVHTPFVDGYLAQTYPGREAEMFKKLSATQPIGRMGTPEEIASLATFLCSDEASFITGSFYPIDGGFISLKPN